MIDFRYTAGDRSGSFSIEPVDDQRILPEQVEQQLVAELDAKGLQIRPEKRRYLRSSIIVALARDLLAKGHVDLEPIEVVPVEQDGQAGQPDPNLDKPPPGLGEVYTLINISPGWLARRRYSDSQSVGDVAADLRRIYKLSPNDNITLATVVNGTRRELQPHELLESLPLRELYWKSERYR